MIVWYICANERHLLLLALWCAFASVLIICSEFGMRRFSKEFPSSEFMGLIVCVFPFWGFWSDISIGGRRKGIPVGRVSHERSILLQKGAHVRPRRKASCSKYMPKQSFVCCSSVVYMWLRATLMIHEANKNSTTRRNGQMSTQSGHQKKK
jgi:hypothetical protein